MRPWFRISLTRCNFLRIKQGHTLDQTRVIGEARLPQFLRTFGETYLLGADPDLVGNFDEAMCNNSGHAKVVGMTMSQVAGVETEIPHISVAPVIVANGTLRTSP